MENSPSSKNPAEKQQQGNLINIEDENPSKTSKKRPAESIDPENKEIQKYKELKEVKVFNYDEYTKHSEALKLIDQYNEHKKNYNSVGTLEIFDNLISPLVISPNPLDERFSNGKDVFIFESQLSKDIAQVMKTQISLRSREIQITGPKGIGKSYGLLAEVLRLRKEGNIVVYINNPSDWITLPNNTNYLIEELIFASIPLSHNILNPNDVQSAFEDQDNLFRWYSLLNYHGYKSDQTTLETTITKFITSLAGSTKREKRGFYLICDQENTLMRRNSDNKIVGECFPFYYRKIIGNHKVFAVSDNNEKSWTAKKPRVVQVFKRMSEPEIGKLANALLSKSLDVDDMKLLYKICNGNPLVVNDYLIDFQYQTNKLDFRSFLNMKFHEHAKDIVDIHHQKFLSDKNEEFKQNFDSILPFVDTQINIHESYIESIVYQVMNRQFMVISPETGFLECLYPAASQAFKLLRKGDSVITALTHLLYGTQSITSDTVGRLLEYYIIHQLEKDDAKSERITFKYTTSKTSDSVQEFEFTPYQVVKIKMGEATPPRQACNTLFIPENPNYPCVDLVYLDYIKKILYAIQVTVNMERHKESHENFNNYYFSDWKKVHGSDLRLQFIWVGSGWDPEKLKQETNISLSVTGDSWKITYKQLPITQFPLFQFLHKKDSALEDLLVRKVKSINKLMSQNFKRNTTARTFQQKCSEWFRKSASAVKNTVIIYCFMQEKKDSKFNWEQFNAFLSFATKEDMEEFEENPMPETIEVASNEEYQEAQNLSFQNGLLVKVAKIN